METSSFGQSERKKGHNLPMDFASVTLRRLGSEVAAEAALESNIIEFCALGFTVDRFKGYAISNWPIDRVWKGQVTSKKM